MTLTLTEKAEFQLGAFLQSSTKQGSSAARGIRVSVVDGGCSGYQYALNVINTPQVDDLSLDQGKVRVYIEPKSAPLLEGVVIDYVEGLLESGFKFSNPNATDSCSCGKSFKAGDCTPAGIPCS